MKMSALLLPLCALAALSGPADAVPGGDIGTLPLGRYVCELPGDAAGPPRRPVPEEDFTVVSASSYRSDGIRGSYLLTGKLMVKTSGPQAGKRYFVQSPGFLRLIGPEGQPGKLRCIRTTRNSP